MGNHMPRQSTILQVFVASPSDVLEERKLLETVVTQLNQAWSKTLGVTFELLKWETNVHPSFSTYPQNVINEQIGSDYDVFIGIFWGRIGTPTPRAPSGSIEEFEQALAKLRQNGTLPEIMLYFKDAPISPSKIDVDQLRKVQDFRNFIAEEGGIYSVFEDLSSFESSLRSHLSAIAQKYALQGSSSLITAREEESTDATGSPLSVEQDDDYGYMDYVDIYVSNQENMTSALNAINEATVRVGQQIAERTEEMKNSSTEGGKSSRRIMERTADDLNNYANNIDIQTSILSASRQSAFSALSNAIALQVDFETKTEDLQALRETLVGLVDTTATAKSSVVDMRSAADGLPRLSKEINQSKRAVVNKLGLFLTEIDNTAFTINNIVEAIDRILSTQVNSN
jgi:hypothetical protein